MRSLRSGDESQNVRQARPMNRRWGRICVVFMMLLGLSALSALSARPYLLADTSTSPTPTESSDETVQPPADEPTLSPCESARASLEAAVTALERAQLQESAALRTYLSAGATLEAVTADPNATGAQKQAAQVSHTLALVAYQQASATVDAAQAAVDAAQAAVLAICGPPPPTRPFPPIGDPSVEPCCGG